MMPPKFIFLLFLAFLVVPSDAAPLHRPFESVKGRSFASDDSCGNVPNPIRVVDIASKYRTDDSSYSVVDATRAKRVDDAVAPIRQLLAGVTRYSNLYIASEGADLKSGRCALLWMDAWARADAMSDLRSHDAVFYLSVNLVGLALSFGQVRGIALEPEDVRPRISRWLHFLSREIIEHYSGVRGALILNNHRYWAAAAVGAVAVELDDKKEFEWAIRSATLGIEQVNADGMLPLELRRKGKAMQYMVYACAPLVIFAEVAALNSVDLYSLNDKALLRLARLSLDYENSETFVSRVTGTSQEPIGRVKQSFAWAEFLGIRFAGALPSWFLQNRPFFNAEIGGDTTLMARKW